MKKKRLLHVNISEREDGASRIHNCFISRRRRIRSKLVSFTTQRIGPEDKVSRN
jgi:hypothetical protein